jgi:hypothetical protein
VREQQFTSKTSITSSSRLPCIPHPYHRRHHCHPKRCSHRWLPRWRARLPLNFPVFIFHPCPSPVSHNGRWLAPVTLPPPAPSLPFSVASCRIRPPLAAPMATEFGSSATRSGRRVGHRRGRRLCLPSTRWWRLPTGQFATTSTRAMQVCRASRGPTLVTVRIPAAPHPTARSLAPTSCSTHALSVCSFSCRAIVSCVEPACRCHHLALRLAATTAPCPPCSDKRASRQKLPPRTVLQTSPPMHTNPRASLIMCPTPF